MSRYDAVIIGTGQAGPTLASKLTSAGMRVAIVERDRFGGTCVNYGCTPTKSLVASARAVHVVRNAQTHGIDLGSPFRVDLSRIQARKDEIVAKSRDGLESWLRNMDGLDVVDGSAQFVGPREVQVDDRRLEGERIFINVGTRPRIPDLPGIGSTPYLTSSDLLQLKELPDHLIVVGGGYIALEFAQMFRRFGSEVTVIEMKDRLLPREDSDVCAALTEVLTSEGIDIRTNSECVELETVEAGIQVRLDCDEPKATVTGTHVLLAVGRVPNTDSLGLDAAGLSTDRRGYIEVDDHLRTSVDGIWALGDVNGRGGFTHTSFNDHEIVADQVLGEGSRSVQDRILAYALYTDPPFARVGISETEARKRKEETLIAKMPMNKVSRAVEMGETHGFLKALVDAKSKRILGFTALGVSGDEVVHSALDVMYADRPYTVIERAVHIHPTVSELIPTLLGSLEPM